MLAAGGGRLFGIRTVALAEQEFLGDPAVDHIPRQDLLPPEGTVGVEGGIDPRALEDVAPRIVGEALIPRVKAASLLGGQKERGRKAAVTPCKDRLNAGYTSIVVVVGQAAAFDIAL